MIDALGITTAYEYDALNRLERVVEDVGGKNITTEYDTTVWATCCRWSMHGQTLGLHYTERNHSRRRATLRAIPILFLRRLGRLDHLLDANGTTLSWATMASIVSRRYSTPERRSAKATMHWVPADHGGWNGSADFVCLR